MTDLTAGVLIRYLELSLLIALALLLFRSVRALAERLPLRLGSAGMSRIGRVVFLATLLSPFVAHALLAISDTSSLPEPTTAGRTPLASHSLAEEGHGASRLMAERLPPAGYEQTRSYFHGLEPRHIELAVALAMMFLLSGFAVTAMRTVARLRQLRALLRETVPLRRLGRVNIVVSDRVRVPFSTSVLGRAHVVLPVELLEDAAVLRVALRHELQHYRRSDPLWAIALELFRLLFFWHPGARGWVRELSDLQELSCDEALLRRGIPAKEYGACLLRVAEMAVEQRMVASTAMATRSDRGAHLRRRIDMLFQYDQSNDSRQRSFGLCLFVVVVILATAIASAGSWPTVDDLATDDSTSTWYTDDPLVLRIEALARNNSVTLDTIVAKPADEIGGLPFEIRVTAAPEGLDPVLGFLMLEPDLSIASLTMEMPERAEFAHLIEATLDLRVHKERNATQADPAKLREQLELIQHSLELFVQEEISELRVTLDGEAATLFVRNRNGDCLTDLAGESTIGDALREMLKPAEPVGSRREAPDLEFETATGSKVRLSSLRGRVVLVDFWASWCRPCEEEVLHLKALDREIGRADFEIVGVSLSEDRESFEAFVADHQVPWPQRHEDGGWSSAAARSFQVKSIPSHFLVDRDGRYIQVPLGNPEHLAHAVVELINE